MAMRATKECIGIVQFVGFFSEIQLVFHFIDEGIPMDRYDPEVSEILEYEPTAHQFDAHILISGQEYFDYRRLCTPLNSVNLSH
jgi:hypothetical protein